MQIIIGQVALIEHDKKQDFSLQVIYELKKRKYDVIGLFAGEFIEPAFKGRLDELVYKYGLRDDVVFLGRRNDIPDLLQMVDILIIPSAFEGFPLAGLEASSAGVPVVCADKGGSLEYASISKAGCIFQFDNIGSAADAVVAALSDYKTLNENAIKFAYLNDVEKYYISIRQMFR